MIVLSLSRFWVWVLIPRSRFGSSASSIIALNIGEFCPMVSDLFLIRLGLR